MGVDKIIFKKSLKKLKKWTKKKDFIVIAQID